MSVVFFFLASRIVFAVFFARCLARIIPASLSPRRAFSASIFRSASLRALERRDIGVLTTFVVRLPSGESGESDAFTGLPFFTLPPLLPPPPTMTTLPSFPRIVVGVALEGVDVAFTGSSGRRSEEWEGRDEWDGWDG
jgi:hypothetical protein